MSVCLVYTCTFTLKTPRDSWLFKMFLIPGHVADLLPITLISYKCFGQLALLVTYFSLFVASASTFLRYVADISLKITLFFVLWVTYGLWVVYQQWERRICSNAPSFTEGVSVSPWRSCTEPPLSAAVGRRDWLTSSSTPLIHGGFIFVTCFCCL